MNVRQLFVKIVDFYVEHNHNRRMHPIQDRLLNVAAERNLGKLSYREIGRLIGEGHPQKVKYHLELLERRGLIQSTVDGISIRKSKIDEGILSIPILGAADCGPATIFADENIEGYLRISAKLIRPREGLYALKAVGDSMNRANIAGKTIEHGDYAIVDSKVNAPQTNDYVVSVIGGVCNIKRFVKDESQQQIVLLSESSREFPPIYIHLDEENYFVCGKVVDVMKGPQVQPAYG